MKSSHDKVWFHDKALVLEMGDRGQPPQVSKNKIGIAPNNPGVVVQKHGFSFGEMSLLSCLLIKVRLVAFVEKTDTEASAWEEDDW